MKLPPEIRNRIYEDALCVEGEICPTGLGNHNRWQHTNSAAKDNSMSVSILRTGKQIYGEAAPILYGKNHFTFIDGPAPRFSTMWDLVGMYAFFVIIGRKNRMSVRHLTIRLTKLSGVAYHGYARNARELGESFDILSQGHNLRSLHIEFGDWRRDKTTYWNFFMGKRLVENLVKMKGIGSLTIDGAIDEKVHLHGMVHRERVQWLMETMEVGKARDEDAQPRLSLRLTSPRAAGQKISERVRVLEQEREELKAIVENLSGQVKEIQELSKHLLGLEELRRKVEDLSDLI